MKFSFVAASLLLGCDVDISKDAVDVGGDTEEVRSVGTYVGVVNQSDANVVLVENKSGDGLDVGDVQIVCDAGIVADCDTSVDGDGNLVIKFAAEVASILGCEVRVVTDGVETVVDDGDGDVTCPDILKDVKHIEVNGNGSVDLAAVQSDELDILVTGNGALNIDEVTVTMLAIDLRGAGDATLGGTTTNADLKISGNGDLRAKELTVSDTLDALLNGTGNGVITVLGTVNAEVHGDASLEVYGGAQSGDVLEVDGGEVIFH